MQYLKRLSRATAVVAGFIGAMLTATVALAQGTDSNVTVTNNVSLSFTVNTIPQTANASTGFLVDRKLIVDVNAVDSNWVTVVAGQTTGAPATGVPAMNFEVTNLSNGTENVIVGLLDQDLTPIQTFSAVGTTLFDPTAVVVARDSNGNGAYDDGIDAVIAPTTVGGSIYDLGNLTEDEVVSLVVAADVPAVADAYAAYTLVAAVAAGGAALPNDNSGNGAPGAGPPPPSSPNSINGVADLVFADDDAAPPANIEDEQ
ncbi:MAG: hypothetical protein OES38_14545, partial [Gammaproteobacteria bacterium]|nr:hypothetical protein [Gammaproteobacteria bacterium]